MVTTYGSTFKGPWQGEPQIVIGIDIGTTFSGVGYAFLTKGVDQEVFRVDRWPGQSSDDSSGKIPTLIWYDSNGEAVAFGARAAERKTQRDAKRNGWRLVKEFKLNLHPSDLRREHDIKIRELPSDIPLEKIYSDFLHYLIEHTKSRFEPTIANGTWTWEKYHSSMIIVIAHPNGWQEAERGFLRKAAVAARLGLSSTDARKRIRFVTEAEASVHFCMHHGNLRSEIDVGKNFVLCDAGGSTVDSTLYTVLAKEPQLKLGELKGSACVQAGAIYVNDQAEQYLRQHFADSNAGLAQQEVEEHIFKCIEDFEKQAKRHFEPEEEADEEIIIHFAGESFHNEALGVESGDLMLKSDQVRTFFDPCVEKILGSVKSLVSSTEIMYIALVGGFGGNAYLRTRLRGRFKDTDCQITVPSEKASKAVADGAVIWFGANTVFQRAPRFSYGTDYMKQFEPDNPEHRGRKKLEGFGGTRVDGAWAEIVAKDVPLDCDSVHRHTFGRVYPPIVVPLLDKISDDIYACDTGALFNWLTDESGEMNEGFRKVCTITGNLNDMRGAFSLGARVGASGLALCCVLEYNICIRFGRTELEAFIEWEEEGVKKQGPATILPISSIEGR